MKTWKYNWKEKRFLLYYKKELINIVKYTCRSKTWHFTIKNINTDQMGIKIELSLPLLRCSQNKNITIAATTLNDKVSILFSFLDSISAKKPCRDLAVQYELHIQLIILMKNIEYFQIENEYVQALFENLTSSAARPSSSSSFWEPMLYAVCAIHLFPNVSPKFN